MTRAFLALVRRDLALALRAGGGAGLGVVFFLAVVTVTPFAIGPDLNLLARIGPAILWIGALLASLIGLDRLFAADAEDGSLDLMFMSELPVELAAAAKGIAHWLATGLPLVVAAPVLSLLLNLEPAAIGALCLTLLVGTPAVTFLGLVGAAFAAAFRRGGLLVAVLVMPLTIPVLIFGVAATGAAIGGTVPFGAPFRILAGLSLGALVLGPVAAAAALRVTRE
ncbi:heme exporter protein B [Ancylobacter sp. 3268]|uniref:heme exporter protein CcmB n=1 Tax=Ancylobacter sp. 3268 TaxID=2817752 RepID=UPI002854F736|nr:heme exporter protein CcmB [Ancylobacter sp. 3268]MDR6952491.1 heme exporter protein B [Ancylobacter sp. 3268]